MTEPTQPPEPAPAEQPRESFWGPAPETAPQGQDAPAAPTAAAAGSPASESFWQPAPVLPQPEYHLPPPPGTVLPVPQVTATLRPERSYATWLARVLARLADGLLTLPIFIAGYVLALLVSQSNPWDAFSVLFLTLLAVLAFMFWNVVVRQGQTGSSLGKQWLGIRVVRLDTGVEPGIGLNFARTVLHLLDAPFFLGYLWPIWDDLHQTFADKIVGTVVIMRRS
jgi:uncharacterized RDD family membrane protein YckC